MGKGRSFNGTAAVIKKYDVRAQKKYGQNFLIDENVLSRIVEVAEEIAEIKGISKEEVCDVTYKNALRLYRIEE